MTMIGGGGGHLQAGGKALELVHFLMQQILPGNMKL
jgi:hypothetical protein